MELPKMSTVACTITAVVLICITIGLDRRIGNLEHSVSQQSSALDSINSNLHNVTISLKRLSNPRTLVREPDLQVTQLPPIYFKHGIATEQEDTVITWGDFHGRPLQLVLDKKFKRVIIRVDTTNDHLDNSEDFDDDEVLKFLKNEVEKIASTGKKGPVKLGNSGMFVVFKDKFPVWGPFTSVFGMQKEYKCIYFGEIRSITGDTIEIGGIDMPVGYYPYNL